VHEQPCDLLSSVHILCRFAAMLCDSNATGQCTFWLLFMRWCVVSRWVEIAFGSEENQRFQHVMIYFPFLEPYGSASDAYNFDVHLYRQSVATIHEPSIQCPSHSALKHISCLIPYTVACAPRAWALQPLLNRRRLSWRCRSYCW